MHPNQAKKVLKEIMDLTATPAEGISIIVNEANLSEIQADIEGPQGTPYEGGVFRCRLCLPPEYPDAPPKGYFMTKIFHPNVAPAGDICVNVLQKDWNPDLGLRHVLMVIKCLLVDTNPKSALNEEAGRLLLEDYDSFAAHAKLMTSIHAQSRRPQQGPLTASGGNASAGNEAQQATGSPAKKQKAETGAEKPAVTKPAKPTALTAAKKSLKRL